MASQLLMPEQRLSQPSILFPRQGSKWRWYFFGRSCCSVETVTEFTEDKNAIRQGIEGASAQGDTPLAAAIRHSGNCIKEQASGRAATIVLLTDGDETYSVHIVGPRCDPVRSSAASVVPQYRSSRSILGVHSQDRKGDS
ncbi:MAG: VWA domain-containing protein [Chloroflexi bacterium]|jgi:hypothetical protein|nr:VWA domain-containing protein [Chloroflexota bacterium]